MMRSGTMGTKGLRDQGTKGLKDYSENGPFLGAPASLPARCDHSDLAGRDAGAPRRWMKKLPNTKISILVRRKQSNASSGLQTTGSFSLKEVLRTMGTPVS